MRTCYDREVVVDLCVLNSTTWSTLYEVLIAGNVEQGTAIWAEEEGANLVWER